MQSRLLHVGELDQRDHSAGSQDSQQDGDELLLQVEILPGTWCRCLYSVDDWQLHYGEWISMKKKNRPKPDCDVVESLCWDQAADTSNFRWLHQQIYEGPRKIYAVGNSFHLEGEEAEDAKQTPLPPLPTRAKMSGTKAVRVSASKQTILAQRLRDHS